MEVLLLFLHFNRDCFIWYFSFCAGFNGQSFGFALRWWKWVIIAVFFIDRISLFALGTVSLGWCLSLGESVFCSFFIYFRCVFIDDIFWKSNHPVCCHEFGFSCLESQLFVYLPQHSLIQLLINVIIHVQFFFFCSLLCSQLCKETADWKGSCGENNWWCLQVIFFFLFLCPVHEILMAIL